FFGFFFFLSSWPPRPPRPLCLAIAVAIVSGGEPLCVSPPLREPGSPACRNRRQRRPYHGSSAATSSRRNDSTSVTRPTDCQDPRSLSLVTTAGLMSTQTVRVLAGSRLPVAIECSIVESISARL